MIAFVQRHILTILLLLPLAGILPVVCSPSDGEGQLDQAPGLIPKQICFLVFLAEFLLSLHLPLQYVFGTGEAVRGIGNNVFSFFVEYALPGLPVSFHAQFGIDGISLWLILLTTFLMPLVVLASWHQIRTHVRGFLVCALLMQTAVIGTLISLNLFLFYVFWELMIVPMFLIIGVWGTGRRLYSAMKFFLFTVLGSLLMLASIIYLYTRFGHTREPFSLLFLLPAKLPVEVQYWSFLAFGLAFAVKIPVFPFHTWLPDAHTDAPTAGSVILAGILLKMGAYGFLRFAIPLFPAGFGYFRIPMVLLGVVGILYGAGLCLVQDDIKRLIAYSSISHLGFVVLGIAALMPQAVAGALFLMISHGLTTGGLFLLIGMLYERRHTRDLSDFGGLGRVVPVFSFFFVFLGLASIGVPGLSGFVGEFLVLLGSFGMDSSLYSFFSAIGIVLAAWYMLRLITGTVFGPVTEQKNKMLDDVNIREVAVVLPLAALVLFLGMYPSVILGPAESSLEALPERKQVIQAVQNSSADRSGLLRSSNPEPDVRVNRKGNEK